MTETQLELDFGLVFEVKEKSIVKLPFFENPKDDNEKLLNLQFEYKHGKQQALNAMYNVGLLVALKHITKVSKKNRFVRALSESEKNEKAHNAITYLVEKFLAENDFVITKNFLACIYFRVLHELFYKRKVDDLVQFVDVADLDIYTAKEAIE